MSLIYRSSKSTIHTRKQQHQKQQPKNSNCLYLGGKEDAKDKTRLLSLGVTHILNVTPTKEANIQAGVPNYFESKFIYKRISVYDTTTSDLLQYADASVTFISNGLHHGSVLVHCQRGVSRSSTCVLFFLMRKLGMRLHDAMQLCENKRQCVRPNDAFITQLRKYEQKCIRIGVVSVSSTITKKRPRSEEVGAQVYVSPN